MTTESDVTITLADGLATGTVYYINKIDSGSEKVIIDPAGTSVLINGTTSFELATQYDSVTIFLGSSSPNLWYIIW